MDSTEETALVPRDSNLHRQEDKPRRPSLSDHIAQTMYDTLADTLRRRPAGGKTADSRPGITGWVDGPGRQSSIFSLRRDRFAEVRHAGAHALSRVRLYETRDGVCSLLLEQTTHDCAGMEDAKLWAREKVSEYYAQELVRAALALSSLSGEDGASGTFSHLSNTFFVLSDIAASAKNK